MPIFNSEKTIKKAIESVINQSVKDWELIIVDDGSTDCSKKIVLECQKECSQIKYIYQDNAGPGLARNKGIELASGKYICFLDSDDYWENIFLEEVDRTNHDGDKDIIYYDLIHEDEAGKRIGFSSPSRFSKCSISELIVLQGAGTLEWGMTKVVKSSIIKENNIKFSDLKVGEEAIFSLEILRYSKTCSFVKKPIYHYIDYKNSQHNKGKLDPWFDVLVSIEEYLNQNKIFYAKYMEILSYLALKAFAINVNRICLSSKFKEAKKIMIFSVNKYNKYNIFRCKRRKLETKVWIVKILARLRLFLLIHLLAKARG